MEWEPAKEYCGYAWPCANFTFIYVCVGWMDQLNVTTGMNESVNKWACSKKCALTRKGGKKKKNL